VARRSKLFLLLALASAETAQAADWRGTYDDPPVPYELGSGWYLRGDIGYKWYGRPDATLDVRGYGDMVGESIGDTGVAGIGVGYQVNDQVRADLTLDYEWPGKFTGRLICPAPCTGLPDPEYSRQSADIEAWTSLVNLYFDVANGSPVTPYIGGGIGASYLVTDRIRYQNPNGTTGSWRGAGKWNFAWAAMVGAALAIDRNWSIDLNYRYVDLGSAKSGRTQPAYNDKPIVYDGINAQEVRLGFRYLLD
jgi:opacity protein-like surface antigen